MVELAGKKIIITGATGFIGRNTAKQLLEAGAQVYALVRPGSKQRSLLPADAGFHEIPGDLAHVREALESAKDRYPSLVGSSPDAFLHFAWGGVNREEIDSPQVQEQNVAQSLVCLKAAHDLGCRVFMDAGSRVEYGITKDGVMSEEMTCHPVNAYGRAKLAFYEKAAPLCREWGMTYDHLRFFSVYGPGDHPWSIISTLTRELPQGKTVSLSACRHRWNFMDIEDASRAVRELLCHSDAFEGQTHIVNVASTDTRVLRKFVEEIHRLCGGLGTLDYGTFVQAKEGALSICPQTDALIYLTEGAWKEKISFKEGILRILASTPQKAGESQ
ncbi:MAG: NAD(P)-dependent oxidoreductase [Clostridiales bacterium]|nr:NAD(P)-dependent oxidoreductase [Clostridiales bacterium]